MKHKLHMPSMALRTLVLSCMMCLTASVAWSQATQLTISGTTVVSSKVYDGTLSCQVLNLGTLSGENPSHPATLSAVARYLDEQVGTAKTVVVDYSIAAADTAWYIAPVSDTLTANIVARMLTVTGAAVAPKVYNQAGDVSFDTLGTLNGVLPIDSGLVAHNAAAHFLDVNAGDHQPVAVNYYLYGIRSNNYSVVSNDTLIGTILPRIAYVSGLTNAPNKVYDGTTNITVTNAGSIDLGNLYPDDTVTYEAYAHTNTPDWGMLKPVFYTFVNHGSDSANYTLVDTLIHITSVMRRELQVTAPEVLLVKQFNDSTNATVITPSEMLNAIEGDTLYLETMANFDSPEVGDNKTITVSYTVTGAQAHNYSTPASFVYSTEGRIILPTILDTIGGIDHFIVATSNTGYCQNEQATFHYRILQGEPTAYRLIFTQNAIAQGFQNTGWVTLDSASMGNITITIPEHCSEGRDTFYVQFYNDAQVITDAYMSVIYVNLPNTYLVKVFDNVVSIDNSGAIDGRIGRFSTYKWYHNDEVIKETKAYHQEIGGLTGKYAVLCNEGTDEEAYVCPITFDNSGMTKAVYAYPNPVINTTTIKLQGFDSEAHNLQVFNSYGAVVLQSTFSGVQCQLDLSTLPQGTYMINVDGATVKTIKL